MNDAPPPSTKRNPARDRLVNLLKVAVSLVGLAVLLLTKVDVGEAVEQLVGMDWFLFLAGLVLFLGSVLAGAYRWGVLVWALGVPVSGWRLAELYFVGVFFSIFLPTGVGGDAVKMYELSRDHRQAAVAISSVLVDRFMGLFVLFAMALLVLVGGYQRVDAQYRAAIALVFVACLVVVGLLVQRTWLESLGRRLGLDRLLERIKLLRELYGSLHLYSPAALLRATGASVIRNLLTILGYYVLGRAVGIDLSLWYYFLFVPLISALLLLPSVGGLGIREGSTVLLFSQMGDESRAAALALAYDLTLLITALIGAVLYIVQGLRGRR